MRWARHVAAWLWSCGRTAGAHGEVVWSWPPDAEATPVVMMIRRSRGQDSRSPGRVRISRQTIAQGRPVVRLTCGDCRLLFCCRRATGISRCPAFPAPSTWRRADLKIRTRADRVARMLFHVWWSSRSAISPSARRWQLLRPRPLRERACRTERQTRLGEGYVSMSRARGERPLTQPSTWIRRTCPLPQGARALYWAARSRRGR